MFISKALLAETAEALRSGTIDVIDYINGLCDKIETNEPQVQAFVPEEHRRERLLKKAAKLKARFPDPQKRPPLYGIPVGVKDIFRVDGFSTRAGSNLPPELFDGKEAKCVTMLKNAGALVAGKTVTTEFAYFEPGPTRNPYNLKRTPGGSSSGSAAGVACGFFPLAFGTQTIGSVIRPAAFCGIIGFKPSFDRIPAEGLIFFSKSVDHVGIFTQDIEGLELAASILCKDWKSLFSASDGQGGGEEELPVLGVPEGNYLAQASYEGLMSFEHQLKILGNAGYTVKSIDTLHDIATINYQHRQMIAAELAREHAEWFELYRDRYRPRTAEIILNGQKVGTETLETARAERLVLRKRLEDLQAEHAVDIWVTPSATGEAPLGIHATGDPIMNLPWTNAGLPTITIPAGISKNKLPFGLQCTAAFMQDEKLVFRMRGLMEALGSR